MEPETEHAADPVRGDDEESLLAHCIERLPEDGLDAVLALAGEDAELAERLRARLAALDRLGLLARPREADAPGSIGPYRVLGLLGEGGMGAVYLARDERTGARVALKIGHPAPRVSADGGAPLEAAERARARFEREIRAASKLVHEGIVAILEVGETGGQPYYAMEYVEGATLARIVEALRERELGFEELSVEALREVVVPDAQDAPPAPGGGWGATYVETVCRWILGIADALAHAHAHGIVHRDVKPSNVIVDREGRAKLFDLGLAHTAEDPALTRSGDLAGSPYYMSPEQIAGPRERVDHRTDVYSLGVTLYELLTLRRPFDGPTSAQVFRQVLGREPPLPRRVNPSVPRDLETICATALEKDPARRYPTMQELADDLRRFLAFRPVRAKPAGPLRRASRFARRNPAAASALLLGGLVLLGLPIGLLAANAAVRAEERAALLEADRKTRVTEFLVDQFELTEAEHGQGATISARELLDRGVERLEGAFEDDPLVRAELYAATGTVYANLGLAGRAIPLLDRALAIRQSLPDPDPTSLVTLLDALASAHLRAGDAATARRLCARGLGLLEEASLLGGPDEAALRRTLASAAGATGDADEVERSLTVALSILRGLGSASEPDTADVLEDLGVAARERGDLALARGRIAESLAIRRRAWSPDLERIARTTEELARVEEARGETELAEAARSEIVRYRAVASAAVTPPALPFDPRAFGGGAGAEYERTFQTGITALQARELDRAIASFERCLELDPSRPVCAYNLACGHALAGDVDGGLAWLARAADMGFGVSESRMRVAESDPEIATLRTDPRGGPILERMRTVAERFRRYAGTPAVRLPPSDAGGGTPPLLVVLHAAGRTKDDVVDGPWRTVAAELGAALLAPSGSVPTGSEPGEGLAWLEEPDDLLADPAECERAVERAVRAFLAERHVDRDRVWIAGEGEGAMVAFDLALRAPGLYRGVLLVDGPIHPGTPVPSARRAAALGMRVACVSTSGPGPAKDDLARWLGSCGFDGPELVELEAGGNPDRTEGLRRILAGWRR